MTAMRNRLSNGVRTVLVAKCYVRIVSIGSVRLLSAIESFEFRLCGLQHSRMSAFRCR